MVWDQATAIVRRSGFTRPGANLTWEAEPVIRKSIPVSKETVDSFYDQPEIPSPDESMLVIRFADPHGIDFSYLRLMLDDSFMTRANTIVCPGGKMDLAMQLIFTPMVWRLMERRTQGAA